MTWTCVDSAQEVRRGARGTWLGLSVQGGNDSQSRQGPLAGPPCETMRTAALRAFDH